MPQRLYIKVILPLRLEWEPCYYIPDTISVKPVPGDRVTVRFAGRKQVGVVSQTGVSPDVDPSRILPIESLNANLPAIEKEEIEFWRFISDYYLCTVGEVYKAAYPPLKTASEEAGGNLLQRRALLEEKSREMWLRRLDKLKARLAAKDADLARKHTDSVRSRLKEQRTVIAAELGKAEAALLKFENGLDTGKDFSALLQGIPIPSKIKELESGKPILLKSADRNNYYINAASAVLRSGKNVLILVNETALTAKLNEELKNAFGSLLLVHHSKMTQANRRRISEDIRSGRPYIVIGTRSSIFLPFRDLGLIVVENEESPFYKQSDTAPRYNARDCAIELAILHNCTVILGSSSPSLESIGNAKSHKYIFVEGGDSTHIPNLELIDMLAERRKNGLKGILSRRLIAGLESCKGKAAIIRGFEKEAELKAAVKEHCSKEDFDILTIPQASKTDFSQYDVIAMTSGEALFDAGDFRSDERAFQFLERLRCCSSKVIVQTYQAAHQVFSLTDTLPLFDERRQFNLPPFTRIIDLQFHFSDAPDILARTLRAAGFAATCFGPTIRITLKKDKFLLARKAELRSILDQYRKDHPRERFHIDVDPV